MTAPAKKLIEVALPLPEINDASAYDKMPGIGPHPKGIHHWWARLPLPTARAVLFASVVDDPSAHPEKFPTEAAQNAERERLFDIIRRLMQKRLHEHPEVYAEARREMEKYCDGKLPPVLDPFAGGGSIPLEANRLGFEAHAADLNPVAVLLNKCNLEIAPRWLARPPVNPQSRRRIAGTQGWRGTHGLAEDIRYYGTLLRERAQELIGHLYPKVSLVKDQGNGEANAIAWLWTRTVASPDPAARGKHVPLVSSFMLAMASGKQTWAELVKDDASPRGWRFKVRRGNLSKEEVAKAKLGTRAGKAQDFLCFLTGTPIARSYIQAQGKARRLGQALMTVVADGPKGRVYVSPDIEQEQYAVKSPDGKVVSDARSSFLAGPLPNRAGITGGVCSAYGLDTWGELFSPRQIVALVTMSDLIKDLPAEVARDGSAAGMAAEDAAAYASAISTFLALNLDRCADLNNALCTWNSSDEVLRNLFKRQALPMVWDFAEANFLADVVGGWTTCIERTAKCILTLTCGNGGTARQADAADGATSVNGLLVSTDPPYYDNIGYAALSDFFYVWLRRSIGGLHSEIFATVLTPKDPELTATPVRFDGNRERAKEHFESGFGQAFSKLRERLDPSVPLTVYYAFKQSDEEESGGDGDDLNSGGVDLTTGWETLLEALLSSGFTITATWPVRASQKWRMVAKSANTLASYIVLACRPRPKVAPQTGRRELVAELKRELPSALRHLQQGNVAPVDFAQAAIGPGMAVFSRFSRVLESSGQGMTVRTALALINQILGEVLTAQEDEFDADTRWALAWFEQKGFAEGEFGDANTLATAKNTAVNGLVDAGILHSGRGKVRLLRPEELDKDWDPVSDDRLTVWGMTHHLLRVFYVEKQGEAATAALLRKLGSRAEVARDLGYRLFRVAEKLHSQDAQAYNALVLAWPDLVKLAQAQPGAGPVQGEMI
jgi:putative DNA methylase